MIKWSSTKIPGQHKGEKIASSTNGFRETGYPWAKGCNWTHLTSYKEINSNLIKGL